MSAYCGLCWWCHYGWPKQIADIYFDAQKKLDVLGYGDSVLHFSAGHVVWEDENFESAQDCLDNFDKWKGDYTEPELQILRESLIKLVAIPDELKTLSEAYENNEDETKGLDDFPPPKDLIMIKI